MGDLELFLFTTLSFKALNVSIALASVPPFSFVYLMACKLEFPPRTPSNITALISITLLNNLFKTTEGSYFPPLQACL